MPAMRIKLLVALVTPEICGTYLSQQALMAVNTPSKLCPRLKYTKTRAAKEETDERPGASGRGPGRAPTAGWHRMVGVLKPNKLPWGSINLALVGKHMLRILTVDIIARLVDSITVNEALTYLKNTTGCKEWDRVNVEQEPAARADRLIETAAALTNSPSVEKEPNRTLTGVTGHRMVRVPRLKIPWKTVAHVSLIESR